MFPYNLSPNNPDTYDFGHKVKRWGTGTRLTPEEEAPAMRGSNGCLSPSL